MRLTGNTIFVTGGGSGIGKALAEQLHALGNQVIIGGRRSGLLAEIARANEGMAFVPLDIADTASITAAASRIMADFPALNMLINAAGLQHKDDPASPINDNDLAEMVAVNFLGTVRTTSAFIDHFKNRPEAAIIHVSSMLAYLPLAQISIYCATKAALHSFILSQRYQLRGTNVRVREINPPYVQTDLLNGRLDPRAMPLDQFISETMAVLETDAEEIFVPTAQARRDRLRPDELAMMESFNEMMGTV